MLKKKENQNQRENYICRQLEIFSPLDLSLYTFSIQPYKND